MVVSERFPKYAHNPEIPAMAWSGQLVALRRKNAVTPARTLVQKETTNSPRRKCDSPLTIGDTCPKKAMMRQKEKLTMM
jgi:hypothetical protein